MRIEISHRSKNFDTFRAAKVKSLFNAENGHEWRHVADIPIEDEWRIGMIVGPSGSGKTSLGRAIWSGADVHDLYAGWEKDLPIVESIAPGLPLNDVTAALGAVGLGDVPAWLRPFNMLSNGEQFRAGLARLICEPPARCVVDEFTSVIDRQVAAIGAAAFAKAWRKNAAGQIILLSCHYDIIDWVQPDWVYDTREGVATKKPEAAQAFSFKFGKQTAPIGSILKSITI